jgi:hypothetical protein
MNGEVFRLTPAKTRVYARRRSGDLSYLDLRTRREHPITSYRCDNAACTAATDTHLLVVQSSQFKIQVALVDVAADTTLMTNILTNMEFRTAAFVDTDSDGFILLVSSCTELLAIYHIGVDGMVSCLQDPSAHIFISTINCYLLPGRRLLFYSDFKQVVDLNTGALAATSQAELDATMPPFWPMLYGQIFKPECFPCADREVAPVEAYTFAEHCFFGPKTRATALCLLILMHGNAAFPCQRLLERLIAAAVCVLYERPFSLIFRQYRNGESQYGVRSLYREDY